MLFSRSQQGDFSILSSATIWGLFPVITILSYSSVSPLVSLVISSFFAALFFAAVITIRKGWSQFKDTSAYKDILLTTFIVGIIYYLLTFFALKFTSAGNMSIVLLTETFFSFFFFHILRKEPIPQRHVVGAIFIIIGACIVLVPNVQSFKLGDIMVLLAAGIAPLGNFYAQRARKKVSSETIMLVRSTISAIFVFFLMLLLNDRPSVAALNQSFLFLAINGFVIFGLSKLFWVEGIHRISVAKANALGSISPFFTLLFAWIMLSQQPTLWQLFSLLPICIGIILLSKQKKADQAIQEAQQIAKV